MGKEGPDSFKLAVSVPMVFAAYPDNKDAGIVTIPVLAGTAQVIGAVRSAYIDTDRRVRHRTRRHST